MPDSAPVISWMPLKALAARFHANIIALGGRIPELAEMLKNWSPKQNYYILPGSETIQLGVANDQVVTPLPHPVPAPAATDVIRKLYPAAVCNQGVLICGEDMGWLWNGLYQLPCQVPGLPGHQPPLFFLTKDIERLWVMLHLHDWKNFLADTRVRLFVGPDAMARFRQSLTTDLHCPWPRLSVQVDQTLWDGRPSLNEILTEAKGKVDKELISRMEQFQPAYTNTTPESIAAMLKSGRPLKVLGITSRFTTFLQYSMKDWLAGFEQLGHKTKLAIEDHDHEVGTSLTLAAACAEFQPDLVVIIDHYRRELGGLPEKIPMVMWVQDALANIFRREAGAAQSPLDYAMGFAKLELVHDFGYPANRFMSAVIGCDERRFEPKPLSAQEKSDFGCDVSFVSHASTPADVLLQAEIDRAGSPEAESLLRKIYDQLRAVYETGGAVTEPIQIRRMIDVAMTKTKTSIPQSEMPKLMEMFMQRINNALFRHQSLNWVAAMGLDLRLYGRGWEKHPTLSRYAKGIADNKNELAQIYRASRVCLHTSPHGAVHQRLIEGLACGGFFLLRRCPGDVMERHYQTIWNWCVQNGVHSDLQLKACSEPEIRDAIIQAAEILQLDPFAMKHPFIEALRESAQSGFIGSAGTVWANDYDSIAFGSSAELAEKLKRYLSDDQQRQRIADSMRAVVLERFTYAATTRRLLNFISNDLAGRARQKAAA
jgi:glycosyltransferase involved in cell wall biosynthesis